MTLDYSESATPFASGFGLGRVGGRRTFGRIACPPICKEGSMSRKKTIAKIPSPLRKAGQKAAGEEGPNAQELTPEPPILLGREAIRAAWDAAKGSE